MVIGDIGVLLDGGEGGEKEGAEREGGPGPMGLVSVEKISHLISYEVKCFILRTSTERPEAVKAGFCELVGVKLGPALKAIKRWSNDGRKVPRKKSPYGDGHAAEKIVKILKKEGYC